MDSILHLRTWFFNSKFSTENHDFEIQNLVQLFEMRISRFKIRLMLGDKCFARVRILEEENQLHVGLIASVKK